MAEQKLRGTTGYLIGNEDDWVHAVPNYAGLRYASVSTGIDAVFHGNREHLEHGFVSRPGSILPDPDCVWRCGSGRRRCTEKSRTEHPGGTMKNLEPRMWQTGPQGRDTNGGTRRPVGSGESALRSRPTLFHKTVVIESVKQYSI
jgi:hypothetical protein